MGNHTHTQTHQSHRSASENTGHNTPHTSHLNYSFVSKTPWYAGVLDRLRRTTRLKCPPLSTSYYQCGLCTLPCGLFFTRPCCVGNVVRGAVCSCTTTCALPPPPRPPLLHHHYCSHHHDQNTIIITTRITTTTQRSNHHSAHYDHEWRHWRSRFVKSIFDCANGSGCSELGVVAAD